jgi:hypothetical protein
VAEVISHLYVALDQKYIIEEEFERVSALAIEVGNKIGALMRYLRRSGMRGTNFR